MLSEPLRDLANERSPGFVAVLWLTVVLKIAAGVLALALAPGWGQRVPRRLLLAAGWATGVLLTLYGLMGFVAALLAELGVTEPDDPTTVRWYLLLWEPIWILGGLLFLAATAARHRLIRTKGHDMHCNGGTGGGA